MSRNRSGHPFKFTLLNSTYDVADAADFMSRLTPYLKLYFRASVIAECGEIRDMKTNVANKSPPNSQQLQGND